MGRWWLGGTGLFVAVPLLMEVVRDYRKWHLALAADPSAANFWKTAFYLGLGRFAAEIGLVVAIFVILKPRLGALDARSNFDSQHDASTGKVLNRP